MVSTPSSRGLPPRIYVPVVAVITILFFGILAYFLMTGFGVSGSVFGKAGTSAQSQAPAGEANSVQGGGPPAAVMQQLQALKSQVAAHPRDDVALTQLGDMYLAANRFDQAIPYYKRALKANPGNVAAQTGLQQARSASASNP